MCPACLVSIGLVIAKTASGGAATAYVANKLRQVRKARAAASTGGAR